MSQLEVKEIVVPGTTLNRGNFNYKSGLGTYRLGKKIIATIVGLKDVRGSYINVIPLGGRYIPRHEKNDLIIGVVKDTAPNFWMVDINSPYPGVLHVNDTPWHIDYGETSRFLDVGDVILARISEVSGMKRVLLTMKERGLRKLESGHIIEVSPSKVPRIIGKKGSMLALLKRYTNCRIFVGQNGRLWIQGAFDEIYRVEGAIRMIERRSHVPGLTGEVEELLRIQDLPEAKPEEVEETVIAQLKNDIQEGEVV